MQRFVSPAKGPAAEPRHVVFTFRDGKLARYIEAYDEARARADLTA